VDVVLDRNRNAVEWTADLPQAPFAVAFVRFLERARVHVQRRMQPILIEGNPHQRLGHNVS
jgi:hypothetical protein